MLYSKRFNMSLQSKKEEKKTSAYLSSVYSEYSTATAVDFVVVMLKKISVLTSSQKFDSTEHGKARQIYVYKTRSENK